jgi:hypothetical protein
MVADAATWGCWRPKTLTDRNSDVTTLGVQSGVEGFSSEELLNNRCATIDVSLTEAGREKRICFAVPNQAVPAWLPIAIEHAAKLLSLPFNWDGEGGPPVQYKPIQNALNALCSIMNEHSALPQWTPTSAGGVQLDWHENGIDLEIELPPLGGDPPTVFSDRTGVETDWDGALSSHLDELRRLFEGRLSSR